jgi:hypothetical protein
MYLKITYIAVCIAHLLCFQLSAQNNTETNDRFAFVLTKKGNNQLVLESIYGTVWEKMSSNIPPLLYKNSNTRYITKYGISTNSNLASENFFIIKVTTNQKQLILKSLMVGDWREMSFLCTEEECSYLITERSVTEIDDLNQSVKAQMIKTYEALASDKSEEEYDSEINQITTDKKITELLKKRDEIEREEKNKLREAIKRINENQDFQQKFSEKQIDSIKMKEATKTTLNIENQVAIIDNQIAYLERNPIKTADIAGNNSKSSTKKLKENDDYWNEWDNELDDWEEKLERKLERLERNIEKSVERFEKRAEISAEYYEKKAEIVEKRNEAKFDEKNWYYPKTINYLVVAVTFNNAFPQGGSIQDTGIRFGGSRSFEIGYAWDTKLFNSTNLFRLKYGFGFQFNGLKPEGNRIFVVDGDQTLIEDFDFRVRKNKFRMDNLIVPIHLQMGGRENYTGYHNFKVGIGGFVGANLRTLQRLKYRDDDGNRFSERQRGDFNTNNIVYGLSSYIGWDGYSIYAQYNLNPIFKNNPVDAYNFQIGISVDIN